MPSRSHLENLRVVLVNTRNPLNIGAAARAMSNFGCFQLRVVNPFADAWREARSAVGGAPLLANAGEFKSVAEAVADCSLVIGTTAARDRELQHVMRTTTEAEPLIRHAMHRDRVALLFGSEKRGLSNDDLSYCQWLMRIPTRAEHGSMNLGQAVAICLYELARENDVSTASSAPPSQATSAELERLSRVLIEALAESGYTEPNAAANREDKVRRLIHRLDLSSSDAELLLGMLRKMLWKMRNP